MREEARGLDAFHTPINHINQLRRRSGTQDSHGACETKWACVGRYVTLRGGGESSQISPRFLQ